MAGSYDAIVVGGGHNGLVASAYLARQERGRSCSKEGTRWARRPRQRLPGPRPLSSGSPGSYVMSLLPPSIARELELSQCGYKVNPMGPYYQAFPEGGSIKLYADDAKRNYDEVVEWSKKDAEAMPRWDAWLSGLADVLGPPLLTVPPRLGSRRPKDLADTLRLAWQNRGLDVRAIRRRPTPDDNEHRRPP